MKMVITAEAKAKIEKVAGPHTKLLLSLDDGVGPFSDVGSCAVDTSFDLVVVDADLDVPDFNKIIDSNMGPVYYKDYSGQYVDAPGLTLTVQYNQLALKNDSGLIDSGVAILDKTKAPK
ncbi:iron-sulfur cluster biosynthesis family protein [Nicoliella spurrieriana]|uniref:Iron-sulfur cluster biosynthesis family protein n=1 Tax=Nicoliella spurrieriana TaxID=2925830 RepID=A0A976X6M7_9LACO|nr:iron-sulfur cluster biosynthesis family protein [Nicoliella spurrieriana]UQS87407.1 iron-sulfur cluster biosynthesis family protein [Nicoliella spurrieriana]